MNPQESRFSSDVELNETSILSFAAPSILSPMEGKLAYNFSVSNAPKVWLIKFRKT
jgi:hypothetical protein